MPRERRLSFVQALQALGFHDSDTEGDNDNDSADNDEELNDEVEEQIRLEDGNENDEGEIDVFEETYEETSEEEDDEDDHNNNEGFDLRSRNGIQYSRNEIPPALRRRNILTQRTRVLSVPVNEKSAFYLFHTEDMLRLILRETNRKVRHTSQQNNTKMKHFTEDEFCAAISILLRAGVDRDNFTSLNQLWDPTDSRPFYRAAMGIVRFKTFLRCVRFDNIFTRDMRRAEDPLAAISDIWCLFLATLRKHYIPETDITVDEQLVGYRGKAPGRTYLPSKPKKYGIKIFWAAESSSGFVLNGKIYVGRVGDQPERELGKNVVLQLVSPYFNTGRNIVTDNFFTSHSLAVELLLHNLTLLGTVRKHRREIPPCLQNTRQLQAYSSSFIFDLNNCITLVVYVPARYKSVILLSSSHTTAEIQENHEKRKPKMIMDYNRSKGGVDTFDQNIEEFTCKRKTNRWPLLLYFNILDSAVLNAYLLMRKNGYPGSRADFIRKLTAQLATPYIHHRMTLQRTPKCAKQCAEILGFNDSQTNTKAAPRNEHRNAGRCFSCGKSSRSRCENCSKCCCPQHRVLVKSIQCNNCASKA